MAIKPILIFLLTTVIIVDKSNGQSSCSITVTAAMFDCRKTARSDWGISDSDTKVREYKLCCSARQTYDCTMDVAKQKCPNPVEFETVKQTVKEAIKFETQNQCSDYLKEDSRQAVCSGLAWYAILGIVIGALVVAACCCGCAGYGCYYFCKKRRSH